METRSCGDGKVAAASAPRQPIATGQTIPEAEKLSHHEGKAQGATPEVRRTELLFLSRSKEPSPADDSRVASGVLGTTVH